MKKDFTGEMTVGRLNGGEVAINCRVTDGYTIVESWCGGDELVKIFRDAGFDITITPIPIAEGDASKGTTTEEVV